MRGDPPVPACCGRVTVLSTPHARGGSTQPSCQINLPQRCLPRMRGGIHLSRHHPAPDASRSTPHARGSTLAKHCFSCFQAVYPACAGIHPLQAGLLQPTMRSTPHARGSTLLLICGLWTTRSFAPHARGSTREKEEAVRQAEVYPAYAGSTSTISNSDRSPYRLPRMRGDPPEPSPPGVDGPCLPRMRGDPPQNIANIPAIVKKKTRDNK